MTYIDFITNEEQQLYNKVIMENNDYFSLELYYNYTICAWFCNIIYNDFIANSIKITTQFNILNAFKYILPFGIQCYSKDLSDPYFIDDFIKNRVKLYLLNDNEI